MKALNVAVHDTPVGLVAVLPVVKHVPAYSYKTIDPSLVPEPGDVLGVVTKAYATTTWADACEWCKAYEHAERCTCYAPLRFVKVLDVWRIVAGPLDHMPEPCVEVTEHYTSVWRHTQDRWPSLTSFKMLVQSDLPDAEPGGVALHVEWTDCPNPRCANGQSLVMLGSWWSEHRWQPCPTCQTPFVPPSDAPIVEVKP